MAVSREQTFRWNGSNDEVITTVTSAVATFKGVDSMDLPPLYNVIDPDALEAIVDVDSDTYCQIVFEYYGVQVELDSSGDCTVTAMTER